MDRDRIFTKDFIVNFFINFNVYMVFFLFTIIVVEYAMTFLQATASQAGLAAGIFVFSGFAGRIAAGRCAVWLGLKPLLYIGGLIFFAASAMYVVISSVTVLYGVRILQGFGFGVVSTATGTLVAALTPVSRRGEGIGYYTLSVILATAAGPFLGMWFQRYGLYTADMLLCMALCGINIGLAVLLRTPMLPSHEPAKNKGSFWRKYVEPAAVPIGVLGLIIGMSYSGLVSFLTSFVKEARLTEAGAWYFFVYAVCIFLSRPFMGRLLDNRGENYVMYPLLLSFAAGMALLSQAESALVLLLSAAFVGLGYGSFMPTAQAIAVKVAAPSRIGVATATFMSLFDIGMGVGSYVLGAAIPYTGYAGLYQMTAIVILFCIVLYYAVHGKRAAIQRNVYF